MTDITIKTLEKTRTGANSGIGFDINNPIGTFKVFQRPCHSVKLKGVVLSLTSARGIIAKYIGETYAGTRVSEGTAFYFMLTKSA